MYTSIKSQLLTKDKVLSRKLAFKGPGTKELPSENAFDQLSESLTNL